MSIQPVSQVSAVTEQVSVYLQLQLLAVQCLQMMQCLLAKAPPPVTVVPDNRADSEQYVKYDVNCSNIAQHYIQNSTAT